VARFPDAYPTKAPLNTNAIKVTFNKGTEQTVAGMNVVTVTDNRLPIANMTLIMPGGSDAEPLNKVGLGGITATLMERGAGDMPFLAFSDDLENHGVSVDAVDAGDTTRIQISCTTDQLDYAVMRANQMLTSPMLPADEFEKFKRQSIAGLMQGLNNPSSVADRELVQQLYPNSTLGRVTTPQTLQAITLEDVKQWYQKYYQLEGAFVVVSGDVTPQRAKGLTEKLVNNFNRRQKPAPANYTVVPAPSSRRIVLVDNPEGRQAVVRMAIRAYDIRSDDKFAGSLAGNILSAGIESRLNRYVRAEKGLTYGCAAYFRPSRHAGQFSGSVDTNIETTGAAIEAMLKVFNDLRTAVVPTEELKEAQSRVSGGMVMEMQTVAQQAGRRVDQILNEYPLDYWDKYSEQITKVSAEGVKNVMNTYVKDDQMLFIIVAPAAAVKSQLEKLGNVEVLPMPLKRIEPATGPSASIE
jgi:zinc protease